MCNGRSLPDLMCGHSDVLSKLRHQGDNRHKNSYRRKRDLRLFGTGPLPLNLLQIWTHPHHPLISVFGTSPSAVQSLNAPGIVHRCTIRRHDFTLMTSVGN